MLFLEASTKRLTQGRKTVTACSGTYKSGGKETKLNLLLHLCQRSLITLQSEAAQDQIPPLM